MSMGKGRAEFLQKEIVEAIGRAVELKQLPSDWIADIFGEKLLRDASIKNELLARWKVPSNTLINTKS